MDNNEAFMQLVLSNTQGELSPLEIGMHALKAVPLATGGRGQKGGLSEYAERVGRSKQSISDLRSAAEVWETVRSSGRFSAADILERARHMTEISKAPREAWAMLVERLVSKGWTVADTGREVEQIRNSPRAAYRG